MPTVGVENTIAGAGGDFVAGLVGVSDASLIVEWVVIL